MNDQTDTVLAPESVTVNPTFTLTLVAAEKLQTLLAEKKLDGYGLRVFVSGSGCSGAQYGLAFENKTEEGDFVFESNGVRVFLDNVSAPFLNGASVDYVKGAMGEGFRVENPNAAESGCSCSGGCSGCGN
jgi:iron-sulfur cluster assembly accessory protein